MEFDISDRLSGKSSRLITWMKNRYPHRVIVVHSVGAFDELINIIAREEAITLVNARKLYGQNIITSQAWINGYLNGKVGLELAIDQVDNVLNGLSAHPVVCVSATKSVALRPMLITKAQYETIMMDDAQLRQCAIDLGFSGFAIYERPEDNE